MHAATAGPAHILVVDDEPAITDLLVDRPALHGLPGHDGRDRARRARRGGDAATRTSSCST